MFPCLANAVTSKALSAIRKVNVEKTLKTSSDRSNNAGMKINKLARTLLVPFLFSTALGLATSTQAQADCSKNTATIGAMYEAFAKQDIPAILSHLSEDVKWDVWEVDNFAQRLGVPYLQPRTGRSGVSDFFASLVDVDFHVFQVRNIMCGGNQVSAVVYVEATYKPTGKSLKDMEIHLFTLNGKGEVTDFHHVLDTAKHIEATHLSAR